MKTVLPPFYLFILSIAGLFLIGFGIISGFFTIYEMIDSRLAAMRINEVTEFREASAHLHQRVFLYSLLPMTIVFSIAGFLLWSVVSSLIELISSLTNKATLRSIFALRRAVEA